jgi:acetate kinase
MPAAELAATLEHRSGLLGLAGTDDMRVIVERAAAADASAQLALDVYVHRLRGSIAAMTASLGGLDALVFTGGVGEHSAVVRAMTTDALGFLGVALDPARNRAGEGGGEDREIGAVGAEVRTLVITAREDLQIVREVRTVLGGRAGGLVAS